MTKTKLRDSRDFQIVYRSGKRYEGHVVTAFVLPNKLGYHRLGITASRKAVGNAVQRNRAKRLLRETFRLTETSLQSLERKYDWVLNGKRTLLISEAGKPLEEFKRIVGFVASEERISSANDSLA
jgi:ribonuclease P protein component